MQDAEFVVPWVAQDPEVEPAFLLVIPPLSAEGLQALYLGFDIISEVISAK